MAKSKIYSLKLLIENQDKVSELSYTRIGNIFGRLTAIFPVKGDYKVSSPWAFKCLCGNYCVQSYVQVSRGDNNSCGCYRKSKGTLQGKLSTLKHLYQTPSLVLIKEGTHAKSRDWAFLCKTCDTTGGDLNAWEVLRSGKKFCLCSGTGVRCKTRDSAIEDLKSKLENTTWTIISFPETYINKKLTKVDLLCKVCHYTHKGVGFGNSYRKGCPNCANLATSIRLSKNTAWFIEEASRVHKDKYDYSLTVYKSAREKVEIICHEHKNPVHFWQSPDNHKNKGKGCPECKKLRLKYVSFHLSRVEKYEGYYSKLVSGVYLLRLGDQGLFKVGITCDLHKRMKDINRESCMTSSNLSYKAMTLYDAKMLEHRLHKSLDKYKYYFSEVWAGHSECFTLPEEIIESIIREITNYKVKYE